MTQIIIQSPAEEIFRTVQFRRPDGGGPLAEGEVIVSAAVTAALVATAADTTQQMISDVGVYQGSQARYRLRGGVKGSDYLLSVLVTTSNNQKFEERFVVRVR